MQDPDQTCTVCEFVHRCSRCRMAHDSSGCVLQSDPLPPEKRDQLFYLRKDCCGEPPKRLQPDRVWAAVWDGIEEEGGPKGVLDSILPEVDPLHPDCLPRIQADTFETRAEGQDQDAEMIIGSEDYVRSQVRERLCVFDEVHSNLDSIAAQTAAARCSGTSYGAFSATVFSQ